MGFRLANINGRSALVDDDHYYEVAEASGGVLDPNPMEAIADLAVLHGIGERLSDFEPSGSLDEVSLGPPIPRPRNAFAVGLNYQAHVAEAAMDAPDVPLVFAKFSSCIVGPNADIELRCDAGDYEAEMVAVIGTAGRDIAEADAWSHIAGVMAGQDISDRALQFAAKPPHFDLGKSRDTYGPTGPYLVSTDLLADRNAMPITCDVSRCRRCDHHHDRWRRNTHQPLQVTDAGRSTGMADFQDRPNGDLDAWPEMYGALHELQALVFLSSPGIERPSGLRPLPVRPRSAGISDVTLAPNTSNDGSTPVLNGPDGRSSPCGLLGFRLSRLIGYPFPHERHRSDCALVSADG